LRFAAAIFLSSGLLFLLQPLIGRLILPWFGGSASVWTTCMLFFQSLLLAGYAYAHAASSRLAPRRQAWLHCALLALSLLMLPVMPAEAWKPDGSEEPITRILLLLLVTVGLPYFLLSATSPLLQAWFVRARPGADPYRLFAVSNLASLLALVGYPLVVEPLLGNRAQVYAWSAAYGGFALLCAWLAWSSAPAGTDTRIPEQERTAKPGRGEYLPWLALSTMGSVMLLAVTNHLTQNVASMPLLWLAPLTLYLLTFILAFEGGTMLGRNLYRPQILWSVVLVAIGAMIWLLVDTVFQFDLRIQLVVWLGGLFVACLFCHGELYRSRPAPRHLTGFYLTVSAGGALGGLLVAVVAPLVFSANYDLGIALAGLTLLACLRFAALHALARWGSAGVLLAVCALALYEGLRFQHDVLEAERSFYGVLRVKEWGAGLANHSRRMLHGAIMHGEQFLGDGRRRVPTGYYQRNSGVGAALAARQGRGPLHVGVIGLGAGTLAAYGAPGDRYRFYEIDPHVVEMARRHFSFLADSAAGIEIAPGDARLSLEREAPQGFDILVIDAFSGDAIPLHLLTREALALYLGHLKPDGVAAFHLSNRFVSLPPVVARLAQEAGAHAVLLIDEGKEDDGDSTTSDWVLVSRDPNALAAPEIQRKKPLRPALLPGRAWTDDYTNLLQTLK
jgi:hypothetical protein